MVDYDNIIIGFILISFVSGLIGIGFFLGFQFNNNIDYKDLYNYQTENLLKCENKNLNLSNKVLDNKLIELDIYNKFLEKGYLNREDLTIK